MIFYIDIVLLLIATIALARRKEVVLHAFDREATVPLRAILALFVVFEHVAIWEPFKLGQEAVAVFFFMSGYGMYQSYLRKGESYLRGFAWRHFVKLYVPYILLAIVWGARLAVGGRVTGRYSYGFAMVWHAAKDGLFDYILPNSWFIWESFVFGLIFVLAFRLMRSGATRVAMIALGCAMFYWFARFCLEWGYWWWLTNGAFAVGVGYARCEQTLKAMISRCGWRYPIGLIGVFILVYALGGPIREELALSLTGVVVVLALSIMPLPRWGWLVWLGGISYEIYLTHGMVNNVLVQLGVYKYLATLITIAATPLAAWVLQRVTTPIVKKMMR